MKKIYLLILANLFLAISAFGQATDYNPANPDPIRIPINIGGTIRYITVFNMTKKKQDVLVSGTNIKTVNGNTLLGSGDLSLPGGGDVTLTGTQTLTNKTLTTPTLTTPRIANGGSINDTNGNEYLKFALLASAVNEVSVGNAVAGAAPFLSATGNDTNIDFNFLAKGTGGLRKNGNWLAQSAYFYNPKEDGKTISGPNAAGNGSTDDANAIQFAIYAGQGSTNKVIYLPPGIYQIKSSIQLSGSSITLRGAGIGKTIIRIASDFSGTNPLFEANGRSDLLFEDMTVTGNSKAITAAFKINSFNTASTKAARITFNRIQFVDLWAEAILMGATSATPDTHSNDMLTITNCIFQRIYNPSQPIVYIDGVTKYNAINLNQTTARALIHGNIIENCSGDGIFGWGLLQDALDLEGGNWIITNNQIKNCFMGIEINGNKLGRALKIDNNIIKYTNRNVGYCISVDSYGASITNNTLFNVDRGTIEYTAIGGVISGNVGQIVPFSATSGGVAPTVLNNYVSFAEIYGFQNTIVGNNFSYPVGRTGAGSFTPTEFRGIMLIGTTTDPASQPTSYDGISGNSAYMDIKSNTISGFTHKAIDATVARIMRVNIIGNTFRSRVATQNVVSIYGDRWVVMSNMFDLTDSTPAASNGVIGIFSSQSDNSNSLFKDNTIINSTWGVMNTDRLTTIRNTFMSTANPTVVTEG